MSDPFTAQRRRLMDRRAFLSASAAAALSSCSVLKSSLKPGGPRFSQPLPRAGVLSKLDATAPGGIDLYIERRTLAIDGYPGGTICINGSVPGPVIHMREGKEALIRVHNRMTESTSIHWHGLLLPYDMDGVPGISFPGIAAGQTFTYRYDVRQNGTYWYHSHTGVQEQLGHYGQLIIEPAGSDPVEYDREFSVVLSDWTFEDPHKVLHKLKTMEGYYNFQRPTLENYDDQMRATRKSFGEVLAERWGWRKMRMDPTDLADVTSETYTYLMNGQSPYENWTALVEPGERVRLRIVNASAMTYYDFRIAGLPMTVVQADGQNVKPTETDELRIAVAETFDVIVTVPSEGGAFTLFAETMDRSGYTRGTLTTDRAVQAEVPERRERPMLTMMDMGMVMGAEHGGASMDGMDGMADSSASTKGDDHSSHTGASVAAGAAGMDSMPGMSTDPASTTARGGALPTQGLPDRIVHGPDHHGPGSITMAQSAYRQLDDPGSGLGGDGWRVLTYGQLRCLETPRDRRAPTREVDLHLTGNMRRYIWGFDGKKWSESEMFRFVYGERLRINMFNDTMMTHPIHLHGMWMDLYTGGDYADNPRKHTVSVQPSELLTVDITVDAPGQWAFHCHLLYHMDMGMFRTIAVVRSLEGGPIHVAS